MKTNKRFLLAAIFGLALVFTFSACSSDGDDKGDNKDDDKWISYIWKDDGEWKIQLEMCDLSTILGYSACMSNPNLMYYADAGNVTDGIVNLDLPNKISDKYLSIFEEKGCNIFPENIQYYSPGFIITNDKESRIYLRIKSQSEWELLEIDDENVMMYTTEGIDYIYFSKAGKITCNYEYEFHGDKHKTIMNIDAKEGWNKIYFHSIGYKHLWGFETEYSNEYSTEKSTNNILINETELKWFLN